MTIRSPGALKLQIIIMICINIYFCTIFNFSVHFLKAFRSSGVSSIGWWVARPAQKPALTTTRPRWSGWRHGCAEFRLHASAQKVCFSLSVHFYRTY